MTKYRQCREDKPLVVAPVQRGNTIKNPNSFDKCFRQLLNLFVMTNDDLDPNLRDLYFAMTACLEVNSYEDARLFGRIEGGPALFAAIAKIPGLKLENGKFDMEEGYSVSYLR